MSEPVTQPADAGHVQPRVVPGSERLVLCVCEDLAVAQRDLLPALGSAGFEVHLVTASSDIRLALTTHPYELVLCEIGERDGAGFSACGATRSASNLPLIVVLRGAARREILRAYQLGVDAYVLSPFDERELVARAGALVRRQSARPAGA